MAQTSQNTQQHSLRHFLKLTDLTGDEFRGLLKRASELKERQHQGIPHRSLEGKVLAMLFEKSSTRTRVSFEAGMAQLGGSALFLSPRDTQLGRGEPVEDTARVLSSMVDLIMVRTFEHSKVEALAEHSSVPVINGLTDLCHPCQLLADMQTFFEHRGDIKGKTVTWVGDGNNMCHSYMGAAVLLGFKLNIACPHGYEPETEICDYFENDIHVFRDPKAAVEGSDLVVTDVWTSMGQEAENARRLKDFANYQVNSELMQAANPDALFMHCLPAHRGEEITAELMDQKNTVVWEEAENRLHAQKALMEFLLLGKF